MHDKLTPIPASTLLFTLVLDPGVTTGAALFEGAELLSVGAIADTRIERALDQLIFRLPEDSCVVFEDFSSAVMRPGMKRTIEIIGMIKILTRKHCQRSPYPLAAQVKKPFKHTAEALLKAHKPGGVTYLQHHYDAVALGLFYFHTTHPEWDVSAYTVSDILAIEQYSPDLSETKPLTIVKK